MKKGNTIVISILLIVSAILIQVLINDSQTKLDIELIGFFSGIIFGVGISLLLMTLFKKKS